MRKSYDLLKVSGWRNLFADVFSRARGRGNPIDWPSVCRDTLGRFVCVVVRHDYVAAGLHGTDGFVCRRCSRLQSPSMTPREKAMRARFKMLATWTRHHSDSDRDAIDMTFYADRALTDFPDPDDKTWGRMPRKD